MRKALTRAAHVLAAAGVFGLARPALTQTSMPDPKAPHGYIVRTSAQSVKHEVEPATTGATRLEEMQVEVALLANPGTFGCALAAHHVGTGLELRGFVPNKLIREQALEIARKHCTVPVIDKLQMNGIMEVRIPCGPQDELLHSAQALLTEEFGKAADFDVKVAAPGHLVVHGKCKSCEELLEISKKLRSLNGCCAVDIHLTVTPLLHGGHMVTLVTSDGSLTVAAPAASETPMVRPFVLADSAAPISKPKTTTPTTPIRPLVVADNAVPSREPVAPLPGPALAVTQPKPTSMNVPPVPTEKKPELPLAVVKPETPAPVVTTSKPVALPVVVKKPEVPAELPPLKANVPPTLTRKSDVAPLPPIAALPPSKPQAPAVEMKATPAVTPVAASISTASSPSVVTATMPPVAAPVGPAASGLSNVPAYAKQSSNPGWQSVPDPVEHLSAPVTVVKAPPPTGGWPPAYETHPPVQAAYATTGFVTFEDEPLPEPAPVFAKDKTEVLRLKVASLCGSKASSVHVETTADGRVHVHVKTVAPDKNEVLTNSILTKIVPEMASPNVILEVEEPK